jgi:hypothetical protein
MTLSALFQRAERRFSRNNILKGEYMHKFDFSTAIPNPYFERLSKEITFRLDFDTIEYFQNLGKPYGFSAEDMIHRYLRYLAGTGFKLDLEELTLEEREQLKASMGSEGGAPPPA